MANVVSASMGGEKSGSRIRPCSLIQNNNFTQNPIDLNKPLNFSSIRDGQTIEILHFFPEII